jgi:glycosyltransferase involved in cell wall biosynthesis
MLSLVTSLYRSRTHLGEFLERLRMTLDDLDTPWEILLIDDACPEQSGVAAAELVTPGESIRILRLDRNVGQLAAIMIGLGESRGDVVVVIDSDLQDRPEDVSVLYKRLWSGDDDVVAAGRKGLYTTGLRRFTARLFRTTRAALTLGRVPRDAGLFLAARRPMIDRVLALGDPKLHLVSGLARVGASITSVSTEREPRKTGESGYAWWQRIVLAGGALVDVTPLYPLARRNRRRRWSPPASTSLTTSQDVEA